MHTYLHISICIFTYTYIYIHTYYQNGIILVTDAVSENGFLLEKKCLVMEGVFLVENQSFQSPCVRVSELTHPLLQTRTLSLPPTLSLTRHGV